MAGRLRMQLRDGDRDVGPGELIIVPRGTDVYAAVANLSGRAAVLLYRQDGDGWKAFAYTD